MPIPSSDRKKYAPARRVALDAALLAAALMLSYLEHLLPFGALTLLPYFKPGFANVITVLAFSLLSPLDALAISLLRVGITGVLFGSWTSLFFSFCGACMAFLALLLARVLLRRCSYLGVSVLCAAAHNTGQVLAAGAVMAVPSRNAEAFPVLLTTVLPYLLPSAVLFGILTGIILNLLVPRSERWFRT